MEHDELFGLRVGKWIEQDAVDYGEERCVGADPESEREDGDRGKTWALTERADREANVLNEFVEPAAAPLVAGDMLDERDIAEFTMSGLRRLLRRFAAILTVLLRHLQMRSEFLLEFALFVRPVVLVWLVAAMKGRLHASLSFLEGSSTPAMASVS